MSTTKQILIDQKFIERLIIIVPWKYEFLKKNPRIVYLKVFARKSRLSYNMYSSQHQAEALDCAFAQEALPRSAHVLGYILAKANAPLANLILFPVPVFRGFLLQIRFNSNCVVRIKCMS